jgi:hypothetical protein
MVYRVTALNQMKTLEDISGCRALFEDAPAGDLLYWSNTYGFSKPARRLLLDFTHFPAPPTMQDFDPDTP